MAFLINLNEPIIYVWAGHFIKKGNTPWIRRSTQHDIDSEIMMVEKGTMYLKVNGEEVTLKAGQLLFTPPYAKITGFKETTEEISSYWLHFMASQEFIDPTDKRIRTAINQKHVATEAPELNNYALMPQKYTMNDDNNLFVLFKQLLQSINEFPSTQRQNDFFLSFFLCKISTDYLKTITLNQSKQISTSTKVSEWIRVNISQKLTVQQIANEFKLNPSYLSRLFKKETGTSIKSYILKMKIEYAKYLLVSTNLLISEIAEKAYFSDDKQFLHTFKNKTGTTPSKYRNSLSKTHMNSNTVDPKPHLPAEFGTKAIRELVATIIKENEKSNNFEK